MSDNLLHIRDEGTGRPLVLVHGWSCSGRFFQAQIDALGSKARCIVPDLPGHGLTRDRLPLTIESAADALYDYLETKGLDDIVLCGWSMGALVSYSMIDRHGADKVSSIAAIDMSPCVLNSKDWPNGTLSGLTAELNAHFLEAMVDDWPKLPSRIARRLFAKDRPVAPDLLQYARTEIARAEPALLQPMWASFTAQDFRDLLRSFTRPFHLVAGLQSQLYGSAVHQWHAKNVPNFRLHAFEKSGHAPHLEEPDRFNRLLLDLIR